MEYAEKYRKGRLRKDRHRGYNENKHSICYKFIVPYGADDAKEPEQVYQDVMKSVVTMKDERAAYLLLGIENQSDVHYAMPVKNLLYDAINYAKQVQKAANSHREAKDSKGHSKGEFLSDSIRKID